ncbi:DUF535 family protein [Sulfurospirillum sp. UCH001]|uniref:DUF535 family protein n=1 Tax=Sulfurospirillum sp. UCH001 TaxID=1581011 RepID=UPI00082FCE9C|nr:DUF535 family protein [Sulfurospirillum sp. UCH001]
MYSIIAISKFLKFSYFKKLKFILRGIFFKQQINDLFNLLNQKELHYFLVNYPEILNKPFRSYQCCNMPTHEKFKNIYFHYSFLKQKFCSEKIQMIYSFKGFNLLETMLSENLLSLRLCYVGNLGKEGELTLMMLLDNKEIYSIQFSFIEKSNQVEIYLCGIQSRNDVNGDELKDITKKMYGLRPRNFIIFTLRVIGSYFNLLLIQAVKTNFHTSNCSRVKKTGKFFANYNEYWEEEAGVDNQQFYTLSTINRKKEMTEIPSKKRSLFKQRYQMLDAYELEIKNNLSLLTKKDDKTNIFVKEDKSI